MKPNSMKTPCGQAASCDNCPHPCSLKIKEQKEQFFAEAVLPSNLKNTENTKNIKKNYSIGIDLGTTTLAFALYNNEENRIEKSITAMNPQRSFGADVVSRINAAKEPAVLKEMQAAIKNFLEDGILSLLKEADIPVKALLEIAIAGNTVMSHILMGYNPSGLGRFPFKPYSLDLKATTWEELFKDCPDKNPAPIPPGLSVFIFPCASAYIGGDIVSGLYSLKEEKNIVLLDLGTNGEMVLSTKDGIYCASASAGPAFEGGNITCGTGSIPGAIHHVSLDNGKLRLKTIGDKEPVGICGSGIISLLSLFLENGYMDENGLLIEPYFTEGFHLTDNIIFYQKDIRELQLAKSAIRTGLDILFRQKNFAEKPDNFYLSGSFGSHIDINSAINIGLLPKAAYTLLGNSSLKGTLAYLSDPLSTKEKQQKLSETALEMKEILLSKQEDFEALFLENIAFS